MGFGLDEDWEEEADCREPTQDEKLAIKMFDYDYDEFFALDHFEQKQQIRLAKHLAKSK